MKISAAGWPRQRLDDGPLVLHVDQVSRHTPEHVAFPLRVLAVFLAVLHDILRRALVLLNIALEQRLSAELRSEIEQVDQNENGQSRRHGKPPSDIALVLHRDRLIDSDLQSNEKLSRFLCRTPLRAEIYRAAGPRPAPRFRIPDSELRITAGLPFPHGPRHPTRPIRENPRTARTSGLQPCDSGPNMKSARTTTACAAQRVTRARPSRSDATKPPVDGRSRSPPQGSGRCIPRRAGRTVTPRVLTLPASCGQAPFQTC